MLKNPKYAVFSKSLCKCDENFISLERSLLGCQNQKYHKQKISLKKQSYMAEIINNEMIDFYIFINFKINLYTHNLYNFSTIYDWLQININHFK